ncbi:MAG: ribose-phosphate pyrophosphokinase [Firmicutes bacterium]|nr:ribose-phosphate pyrophosphokinase [Bacillota bacterium]MCD8314537.1 ribose-phosphate pyrophosphokinase [Bacillota bacterium]
MDAYLNGELSVIAMRGCEEFAESVDFYLKRKIISEGGTPKETYLVKTDCIRFGNGEAKALIKESLRGHDVFIIADMFNHGVTYKMYGIENRMSPDDHFQDLKRIIGAIAGKAHRVTVIMPMLYEGRQDKRSARESLDCAQGLRELIDMGVSNIVTFDAHDTRVQNAIPLSGFENVQPTYQMIKQLLRTFPTLSLSKDDTMIVSPDEGGMSRCIYYSSVLGIDLGVFYKRRDYTRVENGRNPIVAHEYRGRDVRGMNVIVVDDMISSGESVIDVARQLKTRGAANVYVFCTFGLFCNGLDSFDRAYKEGVISMVFTTNLIYRTDELRTREWYTEVNMCKYIAVIIDTLSRDMTMSELLDPVVKIHDLMNRHNVKLAAHGDVQMTISQQITDENADSDAEDEDSESDLWL